MSQTGLDARNRTKAWTELYAEILSAGPVRWVELLGRKCVPRIERTFLGYELRMGKKRLPCPDMVSARYLSIFAELGFRRVAIPYRPTDTAVFLPRLERLAAQLREHASDPVRLRRAFAGIRQAILRRFPPPEEG
ncbi:MAG: hypothetical protein Kow00109_15550 [Acidobacteriota bacterium]